MRVSTLLRVIAAGAGLFIASLTQGAPYIIHISVDGMGSAYLKPLDDAGSVPNFHRIMLQGAGTLNARDDYDYTVTLPNHVTMATGRGVIDLAGAGHGWTSNSDPPVGTTLQSNKGYYVASVFDVMHDNGRRTAMYAGKTKFSLFRDSYSATNGAPDVTGADNGRNKIDTYVYNASSSSLNSSFISAMTSNPFNYSFIHYAEPDAAGHSYGWGSTQYNTAIMNIDALVGNILSLIDNSPMLKNNTAVILTADHGGVAKDHSVKTDPLDYTIPFYVWGAGSVPGELYAMNPGARLDPTTGRPTYAGLQPIRNADAANLALAMMGLGPVPGSTVNTAQDLLVPEPAGLAGLLVALATVLRRRRPM